MGKWIIKRKTIGAGREPTKTDLKSNVKDAFTFPSLISSTVESEEVFPSSLSLQRKKKQKKPVAIRFSLKIWAALYCHSTW